MIRQIAVGKAEVWSKQKYQSRLVLLLLLATGTAVAQTSSIGLPNNALTNLATTNSSVVPVLQTNTHTTDAHSEQVRTACISGRRTICGRILQVLPDGLVIESGYSDLLRPPLTQSWLVPGTASATRDAHALEGTDPGAVCQGLLFLTDLPKSPAPKAFDYVIIQGYPAGDYNYTSVPSVTRTIRKFAAGLETAVRLSVTRTR